MKTLYEEFLDCQFYTRKSQNLIKLGFDYDKNPQFEFKKIQKMLSHLYLIEGESMLTIMKKFNIPSSRTMDLLFKRFGISSRNFSDAARNALEKGRADISESSNFNSKQCWHTAWNGESVFLRSSYEKDYALSLDKSEIEYTVESLRITYFDSQQKLMRIAIPDFLLPRSNTIVEIKSNYWYDKINMIDKQKAYLERGFNFLLVLDHEEYDYCP